ncbi:MAG: hypothetical protein Q9225_000056 [Loekoesia sp. 1 TL-2023]
MVRKRSSRPARYSGKLKALPGVTKTYKLTYEAAKIEHALFNHHSAKNRWRIGANVLRSFIEYFGTNTEQLDIYAEDGRIAFTSYTEKIIHGKETSIVLDTLDFEEFAVEEKMHIAISVKDFKAIVLHAETLKTCVQASYSFPTRPLQLAYYEHGMQCEFTLMTIGDYRGSSKTPAPVSDRISSALPRDNRSSRPTSTQSTQTRIDRTTNERDNATMPPPPRPASRSSQRFPRTERAIGGLQQEPLSQRPSRPSPPPPKASLDPESLFLPADLDDRQWDEANYEDEEDTLGWDASANNVSRALDDLFVQFVAHIFEDNSRSRTAQRNSGGSSRYHSLPAWPEDADQRIAPTQRLVDVNVCLKYP